MTLLKVVRLLGRFPGVQYLLAYDDETLFRTLSSTSAVVVNDGSAERYMEKIVQYPLLVPPLLQYQQLSRLNDGLAQVARSTRRTDSGDDRLSALVHCFTHQRMAARQSSAFNGGTLGPSAPKSNRRSSDSGRAYPGGPWISAATQRNSPAAPSR
jgi:hypothetical protein